MEGFGLRYLDRLLQIGTGVHVLENVQVVVKVVDETVLLVAIELGRRSDRPLVPGSGYRV